VAAHRGRHRRRAPGSRPVREPRAGPRRGRDDHDNGRSGLLYQDQTGRWESWAYAWALVGPAASGLGLVIWGLRSGSPSDVRNGTWSLLAGLALFLIGYLFFEGVIGISGERLPSPEWVLPAVVIAIGVVVLGRGLMSREQPEQT
jgi:hypothetical protein